MGHDETYSRLIKHVIRPACDEQVCCFNIPDGFLADRQCADVKITDAASQFYTTINANGFPFTRQSNTPRKEGATVSVDVTELENTGVLQEKIPFFRKK